MNDSKGRRRQAPGIFMPVINASRCDGKGHCVDVCRERVIALKPAEGDHVEDQSLLQRLHLRLFGRRLAYLRNQASCTACGRCVSACPEQAITLRRIVESNAA
jgi:NAD-dependent dihydropyrimidine dehydrogenase PreA subunit